MSLYSKPGCLCCTIEIKNSIDDSKANPCKRGDFTSKSTWFKIFDDWISDGPCVLQIKVDNFRATYEMCKSFSDNKAGSSTIKIVFNCSILIKLL